MLALETYLNGCGFYETINVSFVDDSITKLFTDGDAAHLAVTDITRKGDNLLRQTLLGSLIGVLKTNLNVGNTPCRIFEIADIFVPAGKKATLPLEEAKLAMVCDSDLTDLRGVIEGLVKTIDRDARVLFEPAPLVWAQPGARIIVNGKAVVLRVLSLRPSKRNSTSTSRLSLRSWISSRFYLCTEAL